MNNTLSGVLIIDKEKDCTTYDIIRQIKRTIQSRIKIGHTGTLDPIATGLVIILLGKATKLADIFHCLPKTYNASFQFGISTETDDADGATTDTFDSDITISKPGLNSFLTGFLGNYETTPPKFCAKKIKGKPAYFYARNNIDIKINKVSSTIYKYKILSIDKDLADILFTVSKGTYIRSIARDLGVVTGYGCIMKDLRRTAIGKITLKDSLKQSEISCDTVLNSIKPLNEVLFPYCTNIVSNTLCVGENLHGLSSQTRKTTNNSLSNDGKDYFIIGNKRKEIMMIVRKDNESKLKTLYSSIGSKNNPWE